MFPTLSQLERAAEIIYQQMPPTPQYNWPMLSQRIGVDVWLKHENHTPLGAFKVRGGLVYFDALSSELGDGVVCATRGNHGQSVAFAAGKHGIPVTIVVPHGNSMEKNAAMKSLGAKLVEFGQDFQEALEYAADLSGRNGMAMVPSFHPLLITGVGTYSLELFRAVDQLDVLYVPIGLGSGICGAIAVKEALGLETEIVGVVSSKARAYSESIKCGRVIELPATTEIADGMACRRPNDDALPFIIDGISRVVEVGDEQVKRAMRDIFQCTHNVAEGAGAAAVAAVTMDARRLEGKRAAAVLCGANVDRDVFSSVLAGTD